MWTDEYASRVYRVSIRSGGELVFQGVTRRRELVPSPDAWDRIRAAGGPFSILVEGAVIDDDGTVTGDIAASETSVLTLAPAEDDPNGMMLFGAKLRPPHIKVGTVPLLMMNLRIDALDLEALEHRVVFRSSYGPEPTRVHPSRAEEERGGGAYGGPQGGGGYGGPQGGEGTVVRRQVDLRRGSHRTTIDMVEMTRVIEMVALKVPGHTMIRTLQKVRRPRNVCHVTR